jgi:polysaccharide pyruvyl transferase WcaK-like protein
VSARERIDERVFLSVADTIGALSQKFEAEPRLLVLNEAQDGELARRLSALLDGCEVISPRNESELIGEIHGALFALCQRYHGALYCASCGIPTVAISRDPKMCALCTELFLIGVRRAEILSKKHELIARIDGAISRDGANSAAIEERIKQYSRLSSRSIDAILEKFL